MKIDRRSAVQRFVRRHMRRTDLINLSPPRPRLILPKTHQEALNAMVDIGAIKSPRYASRTAYDRYRMHIAMVAFSFRLTKELRDRNLPFYVHCGYRSDTDQNAMFKNGVSKARAGQSPHQFGVAVDIVHEKLAWGLTRKQWDIVGLIGKEVARKMGLKVTWGGDWSFYDPAHWRIENWKDYRQRYRLDPDDYFDWLDHGLSAGKTNFRDFLIKPKKK